MFYDGLKRTTRPQEGPKKAPGGSLESPRRPPQGSQSPPEGPQKAPRRLSEGPHKASRGGPNSTDSRGVGGVGGSLLNPPPPIGVQGVLNHSVK